MRSEILTKLSDDILVRNDPIMLLYRKMPLWLIFPMTVMIFAVPLVIIAWMEKKLFLCKELNSGFLQDPAAILGWFVALPLICIFATCFFRNATSYLKSLAIKYVNIDKMLGKQISHSIVISWRFYFYTIIAIAIIVISAQLYIGDLGRGNSWHFSHDGIWSNTQKIYVVFLLILLTSFFLLCIKFSLILIWLRGVFKVVGEQEIKLTHEKEIWGLRDFAATFMHIYILVLIFGIVALSIMYTNVVLWGESATNWQTTGFVSVIAFALLSPLALLGPSMVTGVRGIIKAKKKEAMESLLTEYRLLLSEATAVTPVMNKRIFEFDEIHQCILNLDKTPTFAVDPTFYKWFKVAHIIFGLISPFIKTYLVSFLPVFPLFKYLIMPK